MKPYTKATLLLFASMAVVHLEWALGAKLLWWHMLILASGAGVLGGLGLRMAYLAGGYDAADEICDLTARELARRGVK